MFAAIGARLGAVTLGSIGKSLASMFFGSKLRTGLTMFGLGSMMKGSGAANSAAYGQLSAYRGY
jgi:hypothetical protein